MARNLIKSAVFVSIWLIISYSVHALLIRNLKSVERGDLGVWNKVTSGQVNADVLFVGASRTLVHFDSDTIGAIVGKECFNIGMDGAPLDLQLSCLETYLKYNTMPEVIVQGLGLIVLKSSEGVYNPEQFLPYLNEERIYETLVSIDPAFWRCRYIPLYGLSLRYELALNGEFLRKWALVGLLNIDVDDHRKKGFWPRDVNWTTQFEQFKKKHYSGITYEIEEEAIKSLRAIIELGRSRNIEIILVYSPEYYENYELTLNRDEIFEMFKSVAAEYGVPFWDYSDIPLTHDTNYFYNSQHLNREGAAIFSDMFARDLQTYLSEKASYQDQEPTIHAQSR